MQTGALRQKRAQLSERFARTSVTRDALVAQVDDALTLATSLGDLYDQLSELRRAELLRSAFATVVLSKDGVIGFTLKTSLEELLKSITAPESSRPTDLTIASKFLEAA